MRFFNWYTEIAITKIQTSEKIICFGQKPQIKNKICLELVARDNDALLPTNFELETFKKKLEANNITYIESKKPRNFILQSCLLECLKIYKGQKLRL